MRWLKDPLLHFLLIGTALFALYGLRADDAAEQPNRIVMTEPDIDRIINLWERKWQRLPTRQELQGLIEQQVREEVLYREALAMGLDENDAVVRRRMAQKMEFISDDLATLVEPGDAQLQAYLDGHAEKFAIPGRVAFSQIYLNADKRGKNVRADAEKLLVELSRSAAEVDITMAGDPFMGGQSYDDLADYGVARLFGSAFAEQLFELPVGAWTGPVESGYGLHLVRIDSRTDSRAPSLEQVRDKVRNEWQAEQRRNANDAFYTELRKRYDIVIERPTAEPMKTAGTN
ncbi:MAG: peptidylprolyl isomerase [Pseudomonadota bacterium]|nr:peptidylprolyl isomerase [Pseudomonadota bacterium]